MAEALTACLRVVGAGVIAHIVVALFVRYAAPGWVQYRTQKFLKRPT